MMDSKQPEPSKKSESSTLSTSYPGLWRFRNNPDDCSIYRVPNSIRRVNPEAYTPQLVLIGPLNHSLKSQALESRGDITKTKSTDYLNMEEHKKIYLNKFKLEVGDLGLYRNIIVEGEDKIRESYSESTAWIKSPEFVDMILHDCVFVLMFILMSSRISHTKKGKKTGDPLMDEPCLRLAVRKDLFLLENQLPYFILDKLFNNPRVSKILLGCTFRDLVTDYFGVHDEIDSKSKFSHFTDLKRCARTETLKELTLGNYKPIEHMHNTDKLVNYGVKFKAVEDRLSLNMRFKDGYLKMPCLIIDDVVEMELSNVIAFEQCHYPEEAHVTNYILFLDYLVHTYKDVDLLVARGIIKNFMGQHSVVMEMVNKLGLGVVGGCSYYYDIAAQVNAYCTQPIRLWQATLRRDYFPNPKDFWKEYTALLLLLMTLIQTVASVLQAMPNDHKKK